MRVGVLSNLGQILVFAACSSNFSRNSFLIDSKFWVAFPDILMPSKCFECPPTSDFCGSVYFQNIRATLHRNTEFWLIIYTYHFYQGSGIFRTLSNIYDGAFDKSWKKQIFSKKIFMVPVHRYGPNVSRLRGNNLILISTFLEVPGIYLIHLGRTKSWVNLAVAQWFWTLDPGFLTGSQPFKRQSHKMVKHTQTIRRQFANELF